MRYLSTYWLASFVVFILLLFYPQLFTSERESQAGEVLGDVKWSQSSEITHLIGGSFFTLTPPVVPQKFLGVGPKKLSRLIVEESRRTIAPNQQVTRFLGSVSLFISSPTALWGYTIENGTYVWFRQMIVIDKPPLQSGGTLQIPKATMKEMTSDDDRKKRDRERFTEIYAHDEGDLTFVCPEIAATAASPIGLPIQSKMISTFASPRKLPEGRAYYHTGTDLRAAVGTPVHASAAGEVVLAEKFLLSGNTVTIRHGDGLFTSYKHLSHFEVKPGDRVDRGHLLGLSGATGRVEGPHLHWEAHWRGTPSNADQLRQVLAPLCDPK